ncbi:MAG: TonB-dependent receptor [Bacteroidales bacterium]|nr:TonB-dependent receptor [Bacteroidales bacterium]
MRKTLCTLMLTIFFVCYANAQTVVTGVVKDDLGEALPSATVTIKGTTTGTITDLDGRFSLKVPDTKTAVLKISFVGMKDELVTLKGKPTSGLQIKLETNTQLLQEVVAIGYGTVKRKDITGSVSSVKASAIAAVPVSSAIEAITGKLAGVQITTTEGSPDSEMKIRVRGGGSITGDNKPLFVVDGFPVESINDIAPNDIESIDVLKDASSTAIYGSRGANGVILVTTKSGKEGKVSVNYNTFLSWKQIAKTLNVLPATDYAKWQYELALVKNDGKADSYETYFGKYSDMDLYKNVATNDWQNLVFGRTGFTSNHNLSINGGADKSKFSFSYSRIDDKAIMQRSDFSRDNLSFKYNTKISKSLAFDFSSRYASTNINGGGMNEQNEKSTSDSRLKYAMIYTPFPLRNLTSESGSSDDTELGNLFNPLTAISDNDRIQKRKTLNMAGSITWELYSNLKARSEFGYDDYRNNDQRYYGSTTYYVRNNVPAAYQNLPAIILTEDTRGTIRNTNTLNYDFKHLIGEKNHLNVMLGHEFIYTESKSMGTNVVGFPSFFNSDNAFKLTTQGVANSVDDYYYPNSKLLSFFGRLNYDYKSRYLLSATFRGDGSSRFSAGNKWGYFPSVATAWRISSEPFMESAKNWLDDLKLRISYGTAGNNNIPGGQMVQSYRSSTTTWINGFTSYWAPSKTMANPDLKWETTITRNAGVDFAMFNSKLSGTVEAYYNTTKDLLINFPVSGTGYDTQYRNMGETQNVGLEFSLNWIAIDKKDFGLTFSGNIGFNQNKINSLGIMSDFGAMSGWASTEVGTDYWISKGGSVGKMYGYQSDGRYEVSDFSGYNASTNKWTLNDGVVDCSGIVGTLRPGSMKLKNINGTTNVVDANDKTIIGDANPLHTGGFAISSRFKSFDLGVNFNWSYGNDVYNANKIEYTTTSKYQYRNMITTMGDGQRWTNLTSDGLISNDPAQLAAMNANTTMWSPETKQFVFSDWAVEDGSFLRLNTVTLGYTLPNRLVRKIRIQNLRFYVTGYNLYCWTNYSGFDPEVSTRRQTNLTPGVDYSAYPKSRQFSVGLNMNF